MKFYFLRITLVIVFSFFAAVIARAQSCGCTYTVPAGTTVVDNAVLGLAPGSTICISAGTRTSSASKTLEFKNFQSANASQRFIFKNCGGQVILQNTNLGGTGLFFNNCKNFRVTGTGHAGVEYGILIDGAPSGSSYAPHWGVRADGKSTDFEMDHVKV